MTAETIGEIIPSMVTHMEQQMKWSWKQSPELMARLNKAQNALRTPIDIVTYAGWCETEAALQAHVEYYEAQVAA